MFLSTPTSMALDLQNLVVIIVQYNVAHIIQNILPCIFCYFKQGFISLCKQLLSFLGKTPAYLNVFVKNDVEICRNSRSK